MKDDFISHIKQSYPTWTPSVVVDIGDQQGRVEHCRARGLAQQQMFELHKAQCLGKRDKSSAGRIDPRAVEICLLINARDEFYTLSSCSGRCFIYQGYGNKRDYAADDHHHPSFQRFRICHELVDDASRYFDVTTLDTEKVDGDWCYDDNEDTTTIEDILLPRKTTTEEGGGPIWLRFEPFILHVMCKSLSAASTLMNAARSSFKNVGLTSWKADQPHYIVAIWGDEGLDMPLSTPLDPSTNLYQHQLIWLQELVNDRHVRNWDKISKFVEQMRALPVMTEDRTDDDEDELSGPTTSVSKRFDQIGDVAIIHAAASVSDTTTVEYSQMGMDILKRNKAIRIVAVRSLTLQGTERAPGVDGLSIVAGHVRTPLITTHTENGVKCIVDLNHTFFSPRMVQDRLRITRKVNRGEKVLVLYCGVGMEALQIAARTQASRILAVDLNPRAIECANLGHSLLLRNKSVSYPETVQSLEFVHEDALECMSKLEPGSWDRIIVPRPKQGSLDCDIGKEDCGKVEMLHRLLPLLKPNTGECHFYDFAADHEFPECRRIVSSIQTVCSELQLGDIEITHVSNAGSVAKRQYRVCVDFRIRSTL